MVVAALLTTAACSGSTHSSKAPPHTSPTSASKAPGQTRGCGQGQVLARYVMPTPTRLTSRRVLSARLRLDPPPQTFRPRTTATQAWDRWLSQRVPCESRVVRTLCPPAPSGVYEIVLATTAWNEGHGYGVGPGNAARIAWVVLSHNDPGIPPTDTGPNRAAKPASTAPTQHCFWWDTFDTFDATNGRPFGPSVSEGSPKLMTRDGY